MLESVINNRVDSIEVISESDCCNEMIEINKIINNNKKPLYRRFFTAISSIFRKKKKVEIDLFKKTHGDNIDNIKRGKDREKITTPGKHPKKTSELYNGYIKGTYLHLEGSNREVFINKKTGQGYKLLKNKTCWDFNNDADLRLNEIYGSDKFYNGKYKYLSNNIEIIEMLEDREPSQVQEAEMDESNSSKNSDVSDELYTTKYGKQTVVTAFKKIQNATYLKNEMYSFEKIPFSALNEIHKAECFAFDVKPSNFMKIKNEQEGYDYIPIDAKLIGRYRSNSMRTIEVQKLVDESFNNRKCVFCYGGKYIDLK